MAACGIYWSNWNNSTLLDRLHLLAVATGNLRDKINQLLKMSTRDPLRKLQLSHSKFLSLAKMIKKACDPTNPTFVNRLSKNVQSLDEVFTELYHDFRMYKLDTNDPDFNSLDDDGKDKFEINDSWMDSIKEEY